MELAHLPFSQACENNKQPILDIIAPRLNQPLNLLEVGTGTGQHAVFFANQLPHIYWQASDQVINLNHINARIKHANLVNLPTAIALDVSQQWPKQIYDVIYSANTLHIMSRQLVEAFFIGVGQVTQINSQVFIYGPFNYQGQFTSESNANFEQWLKQHNPLSGIRDIEWILALAKAQQLTLINDFSMPANNRLLHFIKR
ncbi:DUF938 domain-containing protein [Shewanella sp. OMA3-2]|uniref:DUF938 domain-containing protein n=1 Tax=Shewanella sp. OMA3-2 TaxID=2908650 RepID=UPI001F39087C|nr:DUF938 domain-containing protein [Shewanella sp. OMA3-2]UJF23525.1 class I SAM-dependent methyltransferase [Shewanella sp. OMA3-2]